MQTEARAALLVPRISVLVVTVPQSCISVWVKSFTVVLFSILPQSMPAAPPAVTSKALAGVVDLTRSSTVTAVVSIYIRTSSHSAPAASMPVITIVSPFISDCDMTTLTAIPASGSTSGSVPSLANAPPSVETLKSPVARVGLDLKSG